MKVLRVLNIFSQVPPGVAAVPSFLAQREHITCPHCNREVVIAVRPEYVDWENVAKTYRAYADRLVKRFQIIGQETEMMCGENPAATYFANEIRVMIEDLKNNMEGDKGL